MISLSALLDEPGLAFGTADLDLALAFWNPDLLPAGGTFVDVVGLALCHQVLLGGEPGADPACLCQVGLVLGRAPVNVPGKQPEVCVDDQSPGKERQDGALKETGQDHHDKSNDQGCLSQRVKAVASGHKSYQFFFHFLILLSAIILAPPAKSINWKLKIYKIIEAHLLMCYTGKEQASCNVTCVYEEKELRH